MVEEVEGKNTCLTVAGVGQPASTSSGSDHQEGEAFLKSAIHLQQSGYAREALDLYNKILSSQPDDTQLLYLAGIANLQLGLMEQGIEFIQRSLAISPNDPIAHNSIGRGLQALGRVENALASYEKALAIKPNFAEAHYNRGVVLKTLKRLDEALASYDNALAIRPDFAEAYNDRGVALQELLRLDEALASYDTAIAINPSHAGVYCNRGAALRELGQLEKALANYDAALAIKPDFAEAYNDRGIVLLELMRLDEALASFDKAIANKPDYAKAYCNKAYVLKLTGDFDKGWQLLEWRFKQVKPLFSRHHWLGAESLEGKTILLYAEEGLGDAIQFCRYAKIVSEQGARVFLEVQKPLVRLLQGLDGVTAVIERGQPRPAFDYHCPLMSLPLALKSRLTSIPFQTPYLRANEENVRYWRARIGSSRRLKVGLAWCAGLRPDKPDWRIINKKRNIPLEVFCRELNGIDAEFFSLQKGEQAEAELRLRQKEYWPQGNFKNFMEENKDFSDSAAIIANLDVVISVCTSTAHVSAALGKPTWILTRFDTDWRWQLERDDSPWYKSVKLYRQSEDRLWEPVLRRVASDLSKLAKRSPTELPDRQLV
jgi:tetratricopeptide (TPR) repeat protein